MSIHIYHPNKAVKGFACSFWYSKRNGCLFATLIKQSGWDNENQNGVFKGSLNDPSKKINIKLTEIEACGILDCIERNRPFTNYHNFEEGISKSISFTPWMSRAEKAADGTDIPPVIKGYSFSVTEDNKKDNTKNSFYIGFTFAEARYIREYLIHYLHVTFDAYAANAPADTEVQAPQVEAPQVESAPNLVDL
jgi:hypothetical protein